jgi:hypothetical protein
MTGTKENPIVIKAFAQKRPARNLTPEQKQDRLHRRQFEKTCRNCNLDFRRLDDQYAEYRTELAYTFYNLGRLHK